MKFNRPWGTRLLGGVMLLLPIVLALPAALLLANGVFQDSDQALGGDTSYDVALADLDGDMDLDAFVANGLGNRIWTNQGGAQGGTAAIFQNSGQSPGLRPSRGAALGDLDDNETIDAFVANNGVNESWLNSGGQFSLKQEMDGDNTDSFDVALALLNNDKFPDAFVANNGANEVWFNKGDGTFSPGPNDLGSAWSRAVALGDVNNDGTVDAYVANGTTFALADELWLNNGQGQFSLSNQDLDLEWNEGAALGDLDGDGDLDVFLATWFGSDGVWFNQGGAQNGTLGQFEDSGQALSDSGSTDVALVDVDNDGDLDAVVAKFTGQPSEVWLNNGKGQFTDSGQQLDDAAAYGVAAGDLDLDGDPDLFFANSGANHVWLKSGFGQIKAWFEVAARQNEAGKTVFPWAQPGAARLPVVLDFPAPQALTVEAQITSDGGQELRTIPFAQGETSGELTILNPQPLITDTLTLSLTVDNSASRTSGLWASFREAANTAVKVNPLDLIFINEQSGPNDCLLCMMDWVLKVAGFEPSFWQLHAVQLTDLRASPSWFYYLNLFRAHDAELMTIMLSNPALLWETFDVLQVWTPGIMAADEGSGGSAIITAPQAAGAEDLLEAIAAEAGSTLADSIKSEVQVLDFPSLAGRSMNDALERVQDRVQDQIFLPVTAGSQ